MTKGFINLQRGGGRASPSWQKANRNWAARAAKGSGVRGGSKGTTHGLLLRRRLLPVRALLGRPVRAEGNVSAGPRDAAAVRSVAPAARGDAVPIGGAGAQRRHPDPSKSPKP